MSNVSANIPTPQLVNVNPSSNNPVPQITISNPPKATYTATGTLGSLLPNAVNPSGNLDLNKLLDNTTLQGIPSKGVSIGNTINQYLYNSSIGTGTSTPGTTTGTATTAPGGGDQFWLEDFGVLVENGNFYKVIPLSSMTGVEKLNALSRLFIYLTIICLIIGCDSQTTMILGIMVLVIIILYFLLYRSSPVSAVIGTAGGDTVTNSVTSNPPTVQGFGTLSDNRESNEGNCIGGVCKLNYEEEKDAEPEETIDPVTGEPCQEPSPSNPYMNLLVSDLMDRRDRAPACKSSKKIKQKIEKDFNYTVFDNADYLYKWGFSEHQFHTMPVTEIIGDQSRFAKWLYDGNRTCKEDNSQCFRFEDLRFSRRNPTIDRPLPPPKN